MKKLFMVCIAIILMAGFTVRVMAQTPITQTVSNDARAEVITAIGLVVAHTLEFGGFSPGSGGTVVLSPASVRTATGGVVLLATSITPTAASYTMSGSPNTHYDIVLPTSPQVITRVGNSATMNVTLFTCSYTALSSTTNFPGGTDAFTVGATLTVAANQLPGTYVGPFDVTVLY
jgi:hypothetical protein